MLLCRIRTLAFTCAITLISLQAFAAPLSVNVSAESAILMNADTGAILYEKNPRTLQYPASTTKIGTALYALKLKGHNLDEIAVADQEAIVSTTEEAKKRANYSLPSHWMEKGSSHIGIKKGEELTLRDLLYGLMVASGNDAANVIAQHAGGGDIPSFMAGMNAYFKEIGCHQTTFLNPHGLFHPEHRTTAYDMAVMTREALKYPTFCEIVGTVRYTRPKTNKQEPTTLVQTNRLLRAGKLHYPKAIGVKTGYTSLSQNTFVAAAKKDDRVLIAVLLKTKERDDMFRDAAKLFEAAFNQPKVERVLVKAGAQKFALDLEGAVRPVKTYVAKDLSIVYYPAEEPTVKSLLQWDVVAPPIAKGQRIGELRLEDSQGHILKTVPLLAQEDVASSWFYSIQKVMTPAMWKGAFGLLILLLVGWFVFRLRTGTQTGR